MSADELAEALQSLRTQLHETQRKVADQKNVVDDAKRKVGQMFSSVRTQPNSQMLSSSEGEFRRAAVELDVAFDKLKAAKNKAQTYLTTHFAASGQGSARSWSPTSTEGTEHNNSYRKARRSTEIDKLLITATSLSLAAFPAGAFIGAFIAGGTLSEAVVAAEAADEAITGGIKWAFVLSGLQCMHNFLVLKASGARRAELYKELAQGAWGILLDGVGENYKLFGAMRGLLILLDEISKLLRRALR